MPQPAAVAPAAAGELAAAARASHWFIPPGGGGVGGRPGVSHSSGAAGGIAQQAEARLVSAARPSEAAMGGGMDTHLPYLFNPAMLLPNIPDTVGGGAPGPGNCGGGARLAGPGGGVAREGMRIDAHGGGSGGASSPQLTVDVISPTKEPSDAATRQFNDKPIEEVLDSITRACENAEDSVDGMADFLFVGAPEAATPVSEPITLAPPPAAPPPVAAPLPPVTIPTPLGDARPTQPLKRSRPLGQEEALYGYPSSNNPQRPVSMAQAADPYMLPKGGRDVGGTQYPVMRDQSRMGAGMIGGQTDNLRELRWSIMQQVSSLLDMSDASQLQALHKSLHAQIVARQMIARIHA